MAGLLLARSAADEAEVLTIAVAPDLRRQGIAGGMMRRLVGALRRRGVEALYLEVAEGNLPAQRLYESLGFRQVGRRKRYYPDGADALRYRLEIGAAPEVDGDLPS